MHFGMQHTGFSNAQDLTATEELKRSRGLCPKTSSVWSNQLAGPALLKRTCPSQWCPANSAHRKAGLASKTLAPGLALGLLNLGAACSLTAGGKRTPELRESLFASATHTSVPAVFTVKRMSTYLLTTSSSTAAGVVDMEPYTAAVPVGLY